MKNYSFVVLIFPIIIFFISCKGKERYLKPLFDTHKTHIADSIFVNNTLEEIIFLDSSYEIDSIVFTRYSNATKTLKSVKTFKGGKNIFENIDYYENQNIKRYAFINEVDNRYYYERLYHNNGALMKINGFIFFQGYVIDTSSKDLDVKKGSTISFRIYYPNPPDCEAKIFIKNDTGKLYDVFSKSTPLNFLQTVYKDNNIIGTYKINFLLQLKDKSINTLTNYTQELIFKVIP